MSKASSGYGKPRAKTSAKRPYWEMTRAELEQATAEFDKEFIGETFQEPTPAQHKQLLRANRKRGRPRMGAGVRVISVSIEKGLLQAIDSLAKRKKAKRAELIAQGLRAILDGRVPITAD
jgi:hypothetical protein